MSRFDVRHSDTGPGDPGSVSSPVRAQVRNSAPGDDIVSTPLHYPSAAYADRLANAMKLPSSQREDLHLFGQLYSNPDTQVQAAIFLQASVLQILRHLDTLTATCESLRKNMKRSGGSDLNLDKDNCGNIARIAELLIFQPGRTVFDNSSLTEETMEIIRKELPEVWTLSKAHTKTGERRLRSLVGRTLSISKNECRRFIRDSVYVKGCGWSLSKTVGDAWRKYTDARSRGQMEADLVFVLHVVVLRQFCRDNRELLRVRENDDGSVEVTSDIGEDASTDDTADTPAQGRRKRRRTEYESGKVPRKPEEQSFWMKWGDFLASLKRKMGNEIQGVQWIPYIRNCLAQESRAWHADLDNLLCLTANYMPSALAAAVVHDRIGADHWAFSPPLPSAMPRSPVAHPSSPVNTFDVHTSPSSSASSAHLNSSQTRATGTPSSHRLLSPQASNASLSPDLSHHAGPTRRVHADSSANGSQSQSRYSLERSPEPSHHLSSSFAAQHASSQLPPVYQTQDVALNSPSRHLPALWDVPRASPSQFAPSRENMSSSPYAQSYGTHNPAMVYAGTYEGSASTTQYHTLVQPRDTRRRQVYASG
ncbi:hypothetical protein K474DRAFT_1743509 [Panus rudis PR-1116 ss-1]|nr:hypothetical protein K474DRAFT_1679716 [Panus rudis PR-1116 ss-1]KAI0073920.1 hypothetical protein K474DRAFT_1718518 [Panus rudis PR-1116 ss-1]KAI0078565.1 hypothetical protein K474DRAFT_1743509 [Panus rudis PR-1116 ss-1]